MKTQEPSTKKGHNVMPSSFLQPHSFFLHFYSFVFPCCCFTIISSGSPLFSPCPSSSQGCNLPPICHPALLPAHPPALCLPLPKESCPGAAAKPESPSSQAGFLQRNPSPAYFGACESLTLALGRKPKATHHFVSLNKTVLLVCFISPHRSPLLPPQNIPFPG